MLYIQTTSRVRTTALEMKLLIVLSLIACGYAAKLDRTYLPPSSAATAGGSPGSLNTPVGPSGSAGSGQPASNSGFGQPAAISGFSQPAAFGSSNGPAFGKSTSDPAFGSQPSSGVIPSGQYGQPGSPSENLDPGFSQVAQNFGQGGQDYQRTQPQRSQAAAEQSAETLRSDSQNDGDSFSYSFETSNGIAAEESGVATNGVQAQGAFSYSDDDGQNFRVTYTADENGYQPQGDHLPTPHPIPEEIVKSIEKNAEAAAAGTQEGAYNPNEDNSINDPQQYNYNAPNSYGQGPSRSGSSNQQGSGPTQLYAAPNTGSGQSRPQSGGQSYQPQGPSQTYDASNARGAGSGLQSGGQSYQPQGPSQTYDASNAGGAGSRPQFGGQSYQPQGPAQTYSAPNADGSGSRPQSGSQGYQPQSPKQTYGAPNAASGRPSHGFGQSQPGISQSYGVPSNEASPGANGASQARPNNFGQDQFQPQGPSQQYGAPSRPSVSGGSNGFAPSGPASSGFAPSGPASQPRPGQYQIPQSRFASAGRLQRPDQGVQAQDDSGYQYDKPQDSFRQVPNGRPSNQGPASQYRPQNEGSQLSGPQSSFFRPDGGNSGYPSGPAQRSFGPSSGPNAGSLPSGSQRPSSFGPSTGSAGQGSFGLASAQGPNSNGQSSLRPSIGANGFGKPQGSFPGAATKGAMLDSGYAYNRPGSQSGAGSQPQGSSNAPGSSGQSSFGRSSGANGFGRPQGSFPGTATNGAMTDSGYSYNRPRSQADARSQPQGGSNVSASRPGQNFGGPRQPPSFSEEEGYKY